MNFSFMIILIFVLLIYIKLKLNVKTYIILSLLILLLGINEIYNYSEYTKDNFETKQDSIYNKIFKFNKNLNPYHYSDNIFKTYIIPNKYINPDQTIDDNLSLGLSCKSQQQMVNYNIQKQKLQDQNKYIDNLFNFFKCRSSNKHGCTPIKRNELDDSVYNIIETPPDQDIKRCPNVCFDISDKGKCINQTYYPIMRNETDYKEQLEPHLIECESKSPYKYTNSSADTWCEKEWDYDMGNFKDPTSNRKCRLDSSDQFCNYDKRACIYLGEQMDTTGDTDAPKCFKRCEFLNDEASIEKSKIDCENASYISKAGNIESYCKWNEGRGECKSKCHLYNTGTGTNSTCDNGNCKLTCNSDKYCKYDDSNKQCVSI